MLQSVLLLLALHNVEIDKQDDTKHDANVGDGEEGIEKQDDTKQDADDDVEEDAGGLLRRLKARTTLTSCLVSPSQQRLGNNIMGFFN